MTDKKLNEAYYQLDHLWTGSKTIKESHKITSILRNGVKLWLASKGLRQVHIPPPKEINQYVSKPNEQHQFGLLYVADKIF